MKFLASLANIVKIVFWYTQSFVLKAKSTLFDVNIPYFSHLNIANNKKCSRISRLTQKIFIFTLNQSSFWVLDFCKRQKHTDHGRQAR